MLQVRDSFTLVARKICSVTDIISVAGLIHDSIGSANLISFVSPLEPLADEHLRVGLLLIIIRSNLMSTIHETYVNIGRIPIGAT